MYIYIFTCLFMYRGSHTCWSRAMTRCFNSSKLSRCCWAGPLPDPPDPSTIPLRCPLAELSQAGGSCIYHNSVNFVVYNCFLIFLRNMAWLGGVKKTVM